MSSTTEPQTPSPAPAEGDGAPSNGTSSSPGTNVDLPLPPMTAMVPVHAGASSEWMTKAVDRAISEGPGGALGEPEQIGPYRIVSQLGHGGMGVVYRAEQAHPVRRTVALKVLKTGMDTREVVARFEAERQALAMMSHPGVARVYEAGVTHTGRPYFAMEYVPGVPLTKYCEENNLPLRKRLDLFIQVCRAVQHAHQKGIIHRDLKPSNILVMLVDGEPVPKVIDFGIAKATHPGPALTDRTLHTHAGVLIGTPEYMSPEQAFSDGTDVDTRSDIYSLGVVLYQLLTGALPYEPRTLRHLTPESVARLILDSEPLRPSVRLAKLSAERVDTQLVRREIHGDLDWITLKAIDKDRSRRYESAFALAADIMRYLESQPVTARPPTLGYRAKKFVRRHRLAVSVGGIVTAALVVGLGLSVYGLVQARVDRNRALASQALAEETTKFLDQILSYANPSRSGERDMTLRKLLDETAKRLVDGTLSAKPEVQAAGHLMIGKAYTALQQWQDAEEQLNEARKIYEREHGVSHAKVADALHALGAMYEDREDIGNARGYLQKALAMRKQHLGNNHEDVAETLSVLGNLEALKHQHAAAEALYAQAEKIYENKVGANDRRTLAVKHNRALVLNGSGKRPEAIVQLQEILKRKKANGPETITVANTADFLATLLREEKQLDEAVVAAREAWDIRRNKLDPARVETMQSMELLVSILHELGERDAALKVLEERVAAIKDDVRVPVQMRRDVVQKIYDHHAGDKNLAGMDVWRRELEQLKSLSAEQFLEDARQALLKDPTNPGLVASYGAALARSAKFREALEQFVEATRLSPDEHWYWMQRATLLAYLGDTGYLACRTEMLSRFATTKERTVADRIAKAAMLRPIQGSNELDALVKTAEGGTIEPELADWIHLLSGLARYRKGKYADAQAPLEAAMNGKIHPSAQVSAQLVLAMALKKNNKPDDAKTHFEAAHQRILSSLPGAAIGDLGDGVENWLICHTLHEEALSVVSAP